MADELPFACVWAAVTCDCTPASCEDVATPETEPVTVEPFDSVVETVVPEIETPVTEAPAAPVAPVAPVGPAGPAGPCGPV